MEAALLLLYLLGINAANYVSYIIARRSSGKAKSVVLAALVLSVLSTVLWLVVLLASVEVNS